MILKVHYVEKNNNTSVEKNILILVRSVAIAGVQMCNAGVPQSLKLVKVFSDKDGQWLLKKFLLFKVRPVVPGILTYYTIFEHLGCGQMEKNL